MSQSHNRQGCDKYDSKKLNNLPETVLEIVLNRLNYMNAQPISSEGQTLIAGPFEGRDGSAPITDYYNVILT